jgi:RES domain-containing protein
VIYRSASPRYANKRDLLNGFGSKTAGGRWNPPKSFATIYVSLDPHTALDEVLAHFCYYGFPIESAMPRVTVSVRVRLTRVLDLTGAARPAPHSASRSVGCSMSSGGKSRRRGREALTQALGRIGHELGWEAFLVPSAARRGGVNLVIFPANLSRQSSQAIINVGDLPRRD